jgi:FAD/FMN-containing dehydrogenase
MSVITIKRTGGERAPLEAGTVEAFEAALGGDLLRPGEAAYDTARSLWNGMIDRHPALIVRAAGAADVMRTVDLARDHGLLMAVRGGGHNVAGSACCDDGIMLDLSGMKGIRVDPCEATVRVEPGAVWGEVDRETQSFGLAVPNGIITTTGVAGLTLGGGFGWLSRCYGLTCDHLLEADVVTADGRLRRASADSEPELFWGLRGGGGNLGVVTSFKFRARPVGPEVAAGIVVHPMDRAEELLGFFRDFTAGAPEVVTALFVVTPAPPAPFLPAEWHGRKVAAMAACHAGPAEEGMAALAPLKGFGEPLGDGIAPKPFMAHQRMLDAGQPHGRRYYWKSHYLDDLDPAGCRALVKHAGRSSGHAKTLLMHLGGAIAGAPAGDTAAGHRQAGYVLNLAAGWDDPAEDDAQRAWARDAWEAMAPFASGGVYMNFLSEDEQGETRVRDAYAADQHGRLAALKAAYDPGNLFRVNPNVPPAE